MNKNVVLTFILILCGMGYSQINAKLIREADVHEDKIVFVYGGDIWLVALSGGPAQQLTRSPGQESWPRFSPDGTQVGYSAHYQGNEDVFVIPVKGGIPTRITYHSQADRMVDWHPSGESLLFASNRELGQRSSRQFFSVSANGGFPQKLAIPYGELASYSPDGNKLAYITKITENYPFKRYRGGLASDIIIFDLKQNTAENITENPAADGKPSWHGDNIYFLSDQGENMRHNIWVYQTSDKTTRQITTFSEFDITYMSTGPSNLVFEVGGKLYLMDLASEKYKAVDIEITADLTSEMPVRKSLERNINNVTAAPGGKRVVFEARGELFNVPVKDGFVENLTQSSGAFDRDPAWSPDGKYIAFWSDRSGEFEIYLQDHQADQPAKQMTQRKGGYGYELFWSPDGKHIAFLDHTNTIQLLHVESSTLSEISKHEWHLTHNGQARYGMNWSSDSKWLTYHLAGGNGNNRIYVYNLESKKSHQVSSGFYDDRDPVFSVDGKYLFYKSSRNFSAEYSDMDGTWIYPNSTQLAAIALTNKIPSIMAPKNDQLKEAKDTDEKGAEKKDKNKKEDKEKEEKPAIAIDFQNIEARSVVLPVDAGNFGRLFPFKGKLVYVRFPNTGTGERTASLQFFDFDERKEEEVMAKVQSVSYIADGSKLIASFRGKYGIIEAKKGQKIKEPIPTNGLVMNLIPRQEWKQIFMDSWRRYRDFFYDPNMHQVDWDAMKKRYGNLIKDARNRSDINYIMGNLSAELSAGHTYTFGGDVEQVESRSNGYLGIDWALEDGVYKVKRIIRPAAWDSEVRSPFDQSGIDVQAGDTILKVNGLRLDVSREPYASFDGLAGETVQLTLSRPGEKEPRKVIVKCLSQGDERRLRYLEWIENNRKMVEKLSDGKLGYIYMSNTGGRGQLELVKMFYGQLDKQGFIIDERFNGGGQLADRFLELLQRPVVYNLHWRHGKDHGFPIEANPGPMGMLVNGWAGSGGDGLPWAFQELEAGPIVGERTLGILVGPATGHRLIDGGGITVPGGRLYDNDGHWFWEGEGVTPDFEVWDDPNLLVQGRDPQMEKVVEEVLKLLETKAYKPTPAPPYEDRTAKGFKK